MNKQQCFLIGILFVLAVCLQVQGNPVIEPIADDPNLPRVLVLGDSISIGYTTHVRRELAGEANVHHALSPGNCGPTTRGVRNIDNWLRDGDWEIIYFNFGLHDLKYIDANMNRVSPDNGEQQVSLYQYKKNLDWMIERMRKKTEAVLIFATTTPVPNGAEGRKVGDAKRYNKAARTVMDKNNVAVSDLYGFVKKASNPHQKSGNVHFHDKGYSKLGTHIAERIREALPDSITKQEE